MFFIVFLIYPFDVEDAYYLYSLNKPLITENLLCSMCFPRDEKLWLLVDISLGRTHGIFTSSIAAEEPWLTGIRYFLSADYKEASKYFSLALRRYPQPPLFTLYFIAWTQHFLQKPKEAINAFLNLRDFGREQFNLEEINLMIAYEYWIMKEYSKSLQYLKKHFPSPPLKENNRLFFSFLKASIYERLDSLKKAEEILSSLKNNPWARYLLSLVYLRKSEYEKVFDLLSIQFPDELKNRVRYVKAFTEYMKGDFKMAIQRILVPQNRAECILKGLCYAKLKQFDKAERQLERCIKDYGVDEVALRELILVLYAGKKYEKLIAYADTFYLYFPSSSSLAFIKYLQGISYLKIQQAEKGEALLLSLLNSEYAQPFLDEINIKLGDLYMAKGNYEKALEYYEKVKLKKYKIDIIERMVQCAVKIGQYSYAVSLINQNLVSLEKQEREKFILRREWLYYKLGRYPDSLSFLKGYLKKYSNSSLGPAVALEMVRFLMERKKFYQAMYELKKLEKNPEYREQICLLLAKIKKEIGDYSGALSVLRELETPRIILERALLEKEFGMYDEAMRDFLKVKNVFPCKVDYFLAEIYERKGMKREASFLYSLVYKKCKKGSYRAFLKLCEVELQLGNINKVEMLIQEGTKKFGKSAEILYLYALKERAEGNFENAYKNLLEALRKEENLEWRKKIIDLLVVVASPIDRKKDLRDILKNEMEKSTDPFYTEELKNILKEL